jgi:hypothetical protein
VYPKVNPCGTDVDALAFPLQTFTRFYTFYCNQMWICCIHQFFAQTVATFYHNFRCYSKKLFQAMLHTHKKCCTLKWDHILKFKTILYVHRNIIYIVNNFIHALKNEDHYLYLHICFYKPQINYYVLLGEHLGLLVSQQFY